MADVERSRSPERASAVNGAAPPSRGGGEGSESEQQVRLYVGGLSCDTDTSRLRSAFEVHGWTVADVFVPAERRTGGGGRSRGFGFVSIVAAAAADAERAVAQLDGSSIDGRIVRFEVSRSRSRPRGDPPRARRGRARSRRRGRGRGRGGRASRAGGGCREDRSDAPTEKGTDELKVAEEVAEIERMATSEYWSYFAADGSCLWPQRVAEARYTLAFCCDLYSKGRASTEDPVMTGLTKTLPSSLRRDVISAAFGLGPPSLVPGLYAGGGCETIVIAPGLTSASQWWWDDYWTYRGYGAGATGSLKDELRRVMDEDEFYGRELRELVYDGDAPDRWHNRWLAEARSDGHVIEWLGPYEPFGEGHFIGRAVKSPKDGLFHGISEWTLEMTQYNKAVEFCQTPPGVSTKTYYLIKQL